MESRDVTAPCSKRAVADGTRSASGLRAPDLLLHKRLGIPIEHSDG